MKLLLPLFVLLVGCSPTPPKPPPPHDPAVVPCEAYCAHLRDLGCVGGRPTKKGATCEVVCGNVEGSGYVQNTRTCSMQASSCAAVDICEQ